MKMIINNVILKNNTKTRRIKMRKVIFLIVILSLLFGCASMKSKYDKVNEINNIDAYKQFLQKYPDSEFSNEVKRKLVFLEFEKVKK